MKFWVVSAQLEEHLLSHPNRTVGSRNPPLFPIPVVIAIKNFLLLLFSPCRLLLEVLLWVSPFLQHLSTDSSVFFSILPVS